MEWVVRVKRPSRERGLLLSWEDGFEISVDVDDDEVLVSANREGLISLARHLLTLAQDDVRPGSHIHLTAGQEIETSYSLILERSFS